jgi:hypothetical protein
MRTLLITAIFAATLSVAHATTLQQLTLDDMIQKSTTIARVRVQFTGGVFKGQNIYTHYLVQVLELWKGPAASQIDIVVPGGTADGFRQTIAGAPDLVNGQEYVMYLWTSRSGLTQVIGLSQGLFVSSNGMVTRPATSEHLLDARGVATVDSGMQMTLSAMKSRVTSVLSKTRSAQ